MGISGQPPPLQIMAEQNQLENAKYFNFLFFVALRTNAGHGLLIHEVF
jgi:hypothetical protein